MEYKSLALFIVTLNVVWSDSCGNEDLLKVFSGDVKLCDVEKTWDFRQASDFDNRDNVAFFLTPLTLPSCMTSGPLPLTAGGVIELNFYTKSIQREDFVSISVTEAVDNNEVGKATLSNSVEDGWNTLKVELDGTGNYDAYVTIVGQASSDSVIRLMSVCYKPPSNERKPLHDKVIKLTSNFRAPDVYALQTMSIITDLVNPKVATEVIANNDVNNDVSSENRSMRFIDFEDFWTPITISIAVIIPVLILVLLGWGCYALGKRKGSNQEPEIIYEDVNTIPKPYLVPRVKSVYAESVAGSSYGGRNNNIYSV